MPGPNTIILVRHAEPAQDSANPGLKPEGTVRAQRLAKMLASLQITRIFTSTARRTQETVAPLAAASGLTPVQLTAIDGPTNLVSIQAVPAGVVAFVGHSNTVPAVLQALGYTVPAIAVDEFDRFFVVTLGAGGPA